MIKIGDNKTATCDSCGKYKKLKCINVHDNNYYGSVGTKLYLCQKCRIELAYQLLKDLKEDELVYKDLCNKEE